MIKRAIVIAGLVRSPERFHPFLTELLPFAAENQIEVIVSTWEGELKKYPEIAALLAGSRCAVITQDEPDLIVSGHVLHQVQALDAGLSLVDDGVFVQRLRPDFANIGDVHSFLKCEPSSAPDGVKIAHPFQHKLYVSGCIFAHPFYINDICFAGMAGDLRRIIATPLTYFTKYTRMAPEQLIWGGPVIGFNAVFDAYFRTNLGLIFNDEENSRRSIECMKDSRIYHQALAAFIHLLATLFGNIRGDTDREELARQCDLVTLEEILWGNSGASWGGFHLPSRTRHGYDVGVAEVLRSGHYRPSQFGDCVRAALAQLETSDANFFPTRAEKDALTEQSRELADAFDANTNVHGFRVFRPRENVLSIGGLRPHWRVIGERTAREQELEDEINRLRRLVEPLSRNPSALPSGNVPAPNGPERAMQPSASEPDTAGAVPATFRVDALLALQPDLLLNGFATAAAWQEWLAVRPWLTARFYLDSCFSHVKGQGIKSLWFGPVAPENIVISGGTSSEILVEQQPQGRRALLELTAASNAALGPSPDICAIVAVADGWTELLRDRYPQVVHRLPLEHGEETAGKDFSDCSFELVLVPNFAGLLPDPARHFNAIARLLRPGGALLASMPETPSPAYVGEPFALFSAPAELDKLDAKSGLITPQWQLLDVARSAGFARAEFLFYSSKIGGFIQRDFAGAWLMWAVR